METGKTTTMYIGLQIKDDVGLEKVERALIEIGLNDMLNYDPNKSGIFAMGLSPRYLVDLSQFSDEEIEDEYRDREL